jgi:DNA-binding CsgD family transcriptional regulator
MSEPKLSAREQDVLELAASGLTNRQVAERLGLTVHGVKFHLAGAYRKLGVVNRTAAASVYLHGKVAHLPTNRRREEL